jgi:two-component system chemotaxis response regulator CheY
MAINILIVDDSTTMRLIIKKILAQTHLPFGNILEAVNGKEGLEKMKANPLDLVLADLHMPDMTGHQMIELMHKDPTLSKLPVVVVSTEGDKTILDSLTEMGIKAVIRKPFMPEQLKATIEKILSSKK